jgi:dimethylglycine dehydrogenase
MSPSADVQGAYRVVVIGGGIVGTSVLYHLARLGWGPEVALLERSELTAGSSWHAAGGFHALNDDSTMAALQAYTIRLYKEVEAESGQSLGMRVTGGYSIASTPERWEWLKTAHANYQTIGIEGCRLATPEEIVSACPIVEPEGILGGLFDPHEGRLDPNGATHAFAIAARQRGARVITHNRVKSLKALPTGQWRLETETGPITAEHVVNAGGLWARRVGAMAGVDLPLCPMQHHYLITEDLPELLARGEDMPAVLDLEGLTYLQRERKGVLLGLYERDPRHWEVGGPPWDLGMELLPEDIDRIAPELMIGFRRFPALGRVGVRR